VGFGSWIPSRLKRGDVPHSKGKAVWTGYQVWAEAEPDQRRALRETATVAGGVPGLSREGFQEPKPVDSAEGDAMPKHPLEDAVPYKAGTRYAFTPEEQERRCQDAAESYFEILRMNAEAAEEVLEAVKAGDYGRVDQLFESGRLNGGTRDAARQALRLSADLLATKRDKLRGGY